MSDDQIPSPGGAAEKKTHAPTCSSWRCRWEWRTENGAGVCRLPKDSDIHYVGTVDSHDFLPLPCDCKGAAEGRSRAVLLEDARALLAAVLACECLHDEKGHAYLKVRARSITDLPNLISAFLGASGEALGEAGASRLVLPEPPMRLDNLTQNCPMCGGWGKVESGAVPPCPASYVNMCPREWEETAALTPPTDTTP